MKLQSITAYDIKGERTTSKRLTTGRVRQSLLRILKKTRLCAIATVGPNRRSHVNTAYFAYSTTLDLYFLSHPKSQHCRNLHTTPTTAIAVFDSNQTWGGLDRGVQLLGVCPEARGSAARQAEKAYVRRFKPFARWWAELDPDDIAREYRFYRFITRTLKLFDEREFGGAVFVRATIRSRRGSSSMPTPRAPYF